MVFVSILSLRRRGRTGFRTTGRLYALGRRVGQGLQSEDVQDFEKSGDAGIGGTAARCRKVRYHTPLRMRPLLPGALRGRRRSSNSGHDTPEAA
ncbi:hypothetical protein GCM10007884_00890 [Methylobacterium brachythecii]|uniref:Uncharacterized protein n=1 Tax=Methylobacterium brachythecii TaxID=1176177 RepID=A0ABQ6CVL5_9HYPH|nr:hypothetical protein GCM10007884_00890 [Methylobacterium brachythecii]